MKNTQNTTNMNDKECQYTCLYNIRRTVFAGGGEAGDMLVTEFRDGTKWPILC